MRNQREVEIFGKKVLLSERNAFDVIILSERAKEMKLDAISSHYINCEAINDSLKIDLKGFKYFLRWKFRIKKLFKNLTYKEATELANVVSDLEDTKKKVAQEKQ
jgi:hypothetical protein